MVGGLTLAVAWHFRLCVMCVFLPTLLTVHPLATAEKRCCLHVSAQASNNVGLNSNCADCRCWNYLLPFLPGFAALACIGHLFYDQDNEETYHHQKLVKWVGGLQNFVEYLFPIFGNIGEQV